MSKTDDQYQATLDYLFKQLPMFQRVGPKAFKKDLSNTLALAEITGQPQLQFPAIHIAGTNGKGSTAHLLSAVLQAAGYKTGLYTSPHYSDFRERIKINGEYISKEAVINFVAQYKTAYAPVKPSFFEITVAMAFHYFAAQNVDIAVIETGLGGRLDSTNILNPILSIITNISYDHQNFLGDTLELIAGEKAGIIKTNTPVVIGETHPETKSVFQNKAKAENAPIHFADQHYTATLIKSDLQYSYYQIEKDGTLILDQLKVNLHGDYQSKNIQTALHALATIQESYPIEEHTLRQGLEQLKTLTQFKGRWQVLGENPTILCDSGHNLAGIKAIVQQLGQLEYQQLHFVLGMVNDKDISKILAILPKQATYYFAKANIPRGLEADMLQEQAKAQQLYGNSYKSVQEAFMAAKQQASAEDLIFIGGSIFTVAEII